MKQQLFSLYSSYTAQEAIDEMQSNVQGLTSAQAKQRLIKYGPNTLNEKPQRWWHILWHQFTNPFIIIFLLIIIISILLHEINNAIIIAICLVVNISISFFQEYRAYSRLQSLKQYLVETSIVRRENKEEKVNSTQVVPGDIIILYPGDKIPADCRFISTQHLLIDESILTGESVAVPKSTEPRENATLFNAHSIGFAGTMIITGRAVAVVFATGNSATFATLATHHQEILRQSHLTQIIKKFGTFTIALVVISCAIIIICNYLFHQTFGILELFNFSTALAISAIPEALPVVITFCLAQGAYALSQKEVITKRLSAIEDFGALDILCTDKTGTLTKNDLTLTQIYSDTQEKTLLYAALCIPSQTKDNIETLSGFDAALWNTLSAQQKKEIDQYVIQNEIPFDFEHKKNCLVTTDPSGQQHIIWRGTPDRIIPFCTNLSPQKSKELFTLTHQEEQKGMRMLAVAHKLIDKEPTKEELLSPTGPVELVGLLAFVDPLKESAKEAIHLAKKLGLTIKILSGDTATICGAVAHEVGLIDDPQQTMEGDTFVKLTSEQQQKAALTYHAFARVAPEQKAVIINTLQQQAAVGYLGEGFNDLPALKVANVGVVVQNAAAIVKDNADIILLHKSLLAIVSGVQEGRKTLSNTFKYLLITLTANLGHFYALAFASFFVAYLPLLPIHILLINLLTDTPMIAISTDNTGKRDWSFFKVNIINRLLIMIVVLSLINAISDITLFLLFKFDQHLLRTVWFIDSILCELALIFSLRTQQPFYKAERPSLLLIALSCMVTIITLALPYTFIGQHYLLLIPLPLSYYKILVLIILGYFISTELAKLACYRFFKIQKTKTLNNGRLHK